MCTLCCQFLLIVPSVFSTIYVLYWEQTTCGIYKRVFTACKFCAWTIDILREKTYAREFFFLNPCIVAKKWEKMVFSLLVLCYCHVYRGSLTNFWEERRINDIEKKDVFDGLQNVSLAGIPGVWWTRGVEFCVSSSDRGYVLKWKDLGCCSSSECHITILLNAMRVPDITWYVFHRK